MSDELPLSVPVPLTAAHDVSSFECRQHPLLAHWLKHQALQNQRSASTTYVACAGNHVIGYYCLSAGSVERRLAPTAALRRNMPETLPVFVLGRLAVHSAWEGKGIGSGLLKDAVLRSIQLTEFVAARALLCHAIDEEAKSFYLKHGFLEAPLDSPLTLMISLKS